MKRFGNLFFICTILLLVICSHAVADYSCPTGATCGGCGYGDSSSTEDSLAYEIYESENLIKFFPNPSSQNDPVWYSDCVNIFKNNSKIKKVSIEDKIIMRNYNNQVFSDCKYVEEMDLANFNFKSDVATLVSMERMFSGCTNLRKLDLSGWNTSNITKMGDMFNNCFKLTEIIFGDNWTTSQVTSMGSMFYKCSSLTDLDLSSWNTSKVTNISYMFGNCSNLEKLNLAGWDTSQISSKTSAFYNCTNLKTLTLGEKSLNNNIFNSSSFPNYSNGWYYVEPDTTVATNPLDKGEKKINGDLFTGYNPAKMAGTWSMIYDPQYTITLSEVEENKLGDDSYTYDATEGTYSRTYKMSELNTPLTVPTSPQKTDWTFGGWSGTDLTTVTKEVTITTANMGDKEYSAEWVKNPIIGDGSPADLALTFGYTTGSLTVNTANPAEGHTLSYQWYQCSDNSYTNCSAVSKDGTGSSYAIPTGKDAGTQEYYYCKVTSSRTDIPQTTASADSRIAAVTVEKAELSPSPSDVEISDIYTITSKTAALPLMPSDAGTVSYEQGAVTVTGQALAKAVTENGNVIITLSGGADGDKITVPVTIISTNYQDVTLNVILTLGAKEDAEVSFEEGTSLTITWGDSLTLHAKAKKEGTNGLWTWKSSDESVAIADSTGAVTIRKVGFTEITAEYESDTTIGSAKFALTIKPKTIAVPEAVSGLKWTGEPQTGVPEGDGYSLTDNVETAVGKYTAEASLSDPVNTVWEDETAAAKLISWSIEKADGPAAPVLTGIAPTSEANDDGIIPGCSPDMEYSLTPDFSQPIPCTGTQITGLPAGTYYVRYRETGTHKPGETAAVIVPPYVPPEQAAAPLFTPAGGSYTGPQSVTITCATEGAVIHYTTDGSEPTVNSPVYSGPIPVSENLTIKAFAVKDGMTDSPVVSAVYTIIPVPETYTVTVTTDGRGKAGASLMPENVSKGPDDTQVSGPTDTKVSLFYDPYPGYQFRNWQVEPETGTLTGNIYIIGNANVTITAFF